MYQLLVNRGAKRGWIRTHVLLVIAQESRGAPFRADRTLCERVKLQSSYANYRARCNGMESAREDGTALLQQLNFIG